jgi:outer membrane receptor protein involved in Fe transport
MNKIIAMLSLFLLPLHAASAPSDSEIDQLMPLSLDELLAVNVSISTHSKQQMSKAPSVVSVITAEDIKATGTTNLMEILQSVPGVYVKHNLFAFRPLITMRGAPGTHTLLMVNGAPMRDLVWSNGMFWKGLPASAIERIEIIRGPGSALFGADASAGVINVITKTAGTIQHSEAGLRAGSDDTQAGWVRHGASWNGFDIGLTAEVSTTDGHQPRISPDANGDTGRANYEWDNQDIRFSMAKGSWRLLADFMRHDDLGAGLNGAGRLDPLNDSDDSQYSLALAYDNPVYTRDWGLNAVVRYRDLDYSSGNGFLAPTLLDPNAREYLDASERQGGIDVSGLYTGISRHALRIGGGVTWNEIYDVRHDPAKANFPFRSKAVAISFCTSRTSGTSARTGNSPLACATTISATSAAPPRRALPWCGKAPTGSPPSSCMARRSGRRPIRNCITRPRPTPRIPTSTPSVRRPGNSPSITWRRGT